MAQNLARKIRKGNNLWWIAAFSVVGFFVCVGAALLIRYVFPAAPTPLPSVPLYVYSSPTPIQANPTPFAATLPPQATLAVSSPQPASPTPIPTATAISSYWSWLFPFYSAAPTTAYIPPSPLPPLQVVVVPPSATPTPIPSAPPPPPQPLPNPNACRNVLYPARPGSQWTYYVNTPRRSGNFRMSVAAVDGRQAAVDVIELNTGATARSYAVCDGDVILDFPLITGQKLLGSLINGELNVDYVGGVLAPNEAAFTASNWALAWQIQYRVYGHGMAQYGGRNFYFDLAPSNVQMACQTLGAGNASFETVSVAAGTFNALKVVCRGEGQASAVVNGSQASGSILAQSTQWFAPNIGMVKLQSDFAYLSVFGVSIPISQSDAAGYMELQSYVIGQ